MPAATNVHQVYFWTTIRKNRTKYNLTRGISEDEITKILLHEIVCSKNVASAESQLSKLSGIRKFIDHLKTEREKEDFRKHMRKYINMWLPDCPFEVSTTNRYTIVTHEAAVFARRDIKKGETIKYLCGNLVAITPEQELDLDQTRRNFSIVHSSRKKNSSLFLGPARFANHDCNANARLVTVGSDGMQVVAVRYIERDEEITVTYGDGYFGVDNCECLCGTCELNQCNGWNPPAAYQSTRISTPQLQEEPTGPYSFRRKRKFGNSGLASPAPTSDAEEWRPSKRSRSTLSSSGASTPVKPPKHRSMLSESLLVQLATSESDSPVPTGSDSIMAAVETSKPEEAAADEGVIAPTNEEQAPAEVKIEENLVAEYAYVESSADLQTMPSPLTAPSSHHEAHDTSTLFPTPLCATSTDDVAPTPDSISGTGTTIESFQNSTEPSDTDSIFEVDLIKTSTPESTPDASRFKDFYLSTRGLDVPEYSSKAKRNIEILSTELLSSVEAPTSCQEDVQDSVETLASIHPPFDGHLHDSESELSCLSADEELDDINLCIVRKSKQRVKNAKKKVAKIALGVKPEFDLPLKRYPGDYVRTHLLLGEPYSRWVECSTCGKSWVQQNGYYTRRECPRCERHSKLYGYQWPKTEKKHKGDGERVMDHRTVHRFLYPIEEVNTKKRSRGLLRPNSSAETLPSPPSSQS